MATVDAVSRLTSLFATGCCRATMTSMWFPKNAQELIDAIDNAVLPHEATALDYKQQPPVRVKNSEMAVDVGAMSTEGGVLLYGVAEDRAKKTFSPTPFNLVGFKERISQVVETHVREPVEFAVYELQLDTDPTQGFAAVVVPASLRAPHMVESNGQYQYYGRQPGGNRVLGEADVARLYERRRAAEGKARQALVDTVEVAPIGPSPGRGDLHFVAVPLTSDGSLRVRAMRDQPQPELASDVTAVSNALKDPWSPNFNDVVSNYQPLSTFDGVALLAGPFTHYEGEVVESYVAHAELLDDGTFRYFHAAVADSDSGTFVLRDNSVAHIVAKACFMAGRILDRGEYHGPVEVLVAVVGAEGAVSSQWLDPSYQMSRRSRPTVPKDLYQRHVRVQASKLKDEPIQVARSLVGPLLGTVRLDDFPDPFTQR